MNRMVVKATIGSDGVLHLKLPVGATEANQEVQVTVEPVPAGSAGSRAISASDLLQSGLVGMWADRSDIGDSREFARRLRDQAQKRSRD